MLQPQIQNIVEFQCYYSSLSNNFIFTLVLIHHRPSFTRWCLTSTGCSTHLPELALAELFHEAEPLPRQFPHVGVVGVAKRGGVGPAGGGGIHVAPAHSLNAARQPDCHVRHGVVDVAGRALRRCEWRPAGGATEQGGG